MMYEYTRSPLLLVKKEKRSAKDIYRLNAMLGNSIIIGTLYNGILDVENLER